MKLTRRRICLVMAEPTYKAAVSPVGADAILVNMGSSMDPSGEKYTRDYYRDNLSPLGHVVTSQMVDFKISTELRGGGLNVADILVPEFDPLLLACGMGRTGTAGTGWLYAPESDPAAHGSCCIWWYEDGLLHKAIGCRGTWSLNMTVDKIGVIEFAMKGLYEAPSDAAMPTPTILELEPPACLNIGLTLAAFSPVLSSLQLGVGNALSLRRDMNAASGVSGVVITGRQPSGSVDPEADTLANFNPWSAWSAGTKAAIEATLGADSGNQVTVSVPKAQYDTPKYADRDGVLAYALPFVPTIDSTGDDELTLEFT